MMEVSGDNWSYKQGWRHRRGLPPRRGGFAPPSGNLKILVGDGWVMISTKPFNVRDRLDRLR